MKRILFIAVAALLFGACKERKMIVLSKGKAEISTDNKTIKAGDGGGHEETPVSLKGGKQVFKVTSPAGEASVEIAEDGLYIVNAKNDTVVGGLIKYNDAATAQKAITQEALKHRIDSMILLSEGKNASAANHSFFILPNTAVKISEDANAMVVGPYHRMRSAEKVDGKDPEVYHFNSIKEFRENILKLQALTVGEKK